MQKFWKTILVFFFVCILFSSSNIYAQTPSTTVDVSLKLSLCGDGVVEGSEDCEMNQNISKSCIDYGYQEGILTCDYSCSYDYSNCKYVKYEEPKVEPTKPIDEKKETIIEKVISYLPILIRTFDLDRDGKITQPEFKTLIVEWVSNWKIFRKSDDDVKQEVKGTCDVNGDKVCNILDFSIILYHVDYD